MIGALVTLLLLAQSQGTATIRGRVVDQTGGALPGAIVTVTNTDTGISRETTTDRTGFYTVPSLPLTGEYVVRIALPGFSTRQTDPLDLRAGETATVDATLLASGGTSEITVYGTAQGVRTDEPQLGVTLDSERIDDVPIVGRKLTNLPLLDSAVRPAINTGDLFLNNVLFVVDGSGRRQTTFTLDGSSADDAWGRQTIFTNVPLSAVQEFTVLSNAFSAEYGRTTGGAVNIVTKSGTNVVRGDTLVLFRPARLEPSLTIDALAAINNLSATMKVPDALHQLGGSLGGPLLKDRTHLFVAAEFSHQIRESTISSPASPNAVFTGTYKQVLLNARVDHRVRAGRTLSVKANVDGFSDTNPQGVVGGLTLPSAGRTFTRRAYGGQGGYQSVVSATMMNDAHVQIFYGAPITRFSPDNPSTQFVYPGFATIGESRLADLYSHQVDLSDTIAMSRGRHDMRAGFNAMHSTSGGNGQEFGSPFVLGQFTVRTGVTKPVAELAAADIQSFTQGYGAATYEVKEWVLAAFAQDDIKLRPDLTVNLGLRYERQTLTDDTNNLSPRAGFAYSVAGDASTSVRGGYGVYYSEVRANTAAAWNLNGPTGFFSFTAQPGQPGFPASLASIPATLPPGSVVPPRNITVRPGMASYYSRLFDVSRLKGYPNALLNPRTQSGSIGVEREIARRWFGSVDYVTQHTNRIDRPLDINSPAPFVRTAPGQTRSAAAADLTRPIVPAAGGYRQIVAILNSGDADYDGLQLNVRKNSERASLLASYTLAKVTNTVEPDVPAGTQAPNDPNDIGETERGPGLLDQRHRFVLSGSVRLPYDVAVGGVVTAASGYRYNVTTGTDNNGDGSNSDRPVIDGAVIGRNAGRGDPIYSTDVFAERRFPLTSERVVSARVEAFNVFNRANVAGYNGVYGDLATGLPASSAFATPNTGIANVFPGRQVQFQVRFRF